jgi:hypothetical protein
MTRLNVPQVNSDRQFYALVGDGRICDSLARRMSQTGGEPRMPNGSISWMSLISKTVVMISQSSTLKSRGEMVLGDDVHNTTMFISFYKPLHCFRNVLLASRLCGSLFSRSR